MHTVKMDIVEQLDNIIIILARLPESTFGLQNNTPL